MNTTFKGALQLGVARFSHLAGFGRVKAAKGKAEGEDEKDKDKDKDKDKPAAEGDDDEERMEDEERNESAEGNDGDAGDDDEDEKPEASASDGDDDEDEKDKDKDKAKAKKAARARGIREGRRMERKRIARIMSSPLAARNVALAISLATETGMSSDNILATLKRSPSTAGAERSARNPQIDAGGDDNRGGKPTAQQIEAGWGNAFTKAGAMTARK